jgi:hypothetical protein
MIARRYWSPGMGAAVALAAISAALMTRSLIRAMVLTPLPLPSAAQGASDSGQPGATPTVPQALSAAAVEHDPFRPERRRPAERFRLPGERGPNTAAAPSSLPPIRLIGTAVIGDGGFAMCQRASDAPKLVRVGEKFGDLTLRSVRQGRAVFRAADGTSVEVRVIPAASVAKAGT